ncbi:DUF1564 domain-containing protein, partial [Leptospira noguchii]
MLLFARTVVSMGVLLLNSDHEIS